MPNPPVPPPTCCGREALPGASFCPACGKPLNATGVRIALGWNIVYYDLVLPGWGHFKFGRRKAGLILMGGFLLASTLWALESAKVTMSAVGDALNGGGAIDAQAIERHLAASGGTADLLGWIVTLIWVGVALDALRLKLFPDERPEGKTP